ncbi:hypothetical protein PoB_005240300 [Plakobranchus ocellatus]|uniref:Secreted protein n=1 Tax=Plakobranchus ocellatus TaxID=259542 RepID=A0AAV4C1W1_9GAST|nr:hypothetical protein PoB_005240300 [Plakobranchus ocellatus]
MGSVALLVDARLISEVRRRSLFCWSRTCCKARGLAAVLIAPLCCRYKGIAAQHMPIRHVSFLTYTIHSIGRPT